MKRFTLVLLIRHPSMDPAAISAALNLQPSNAWKAGDQRVTPRGTVLPGTHKHTSWNYVQEWTDDSSASDEMAGFVSRLDAYQQFFAALGAQGGYAELSVQLPGEMNQGGCISPLTLRQAANLHLTLGFEVFPDY
jgi:hypothetical protein